MDVIKVEVDSRVLLHEQKEEMFLQLERAVEAIYGGKASVSLEPSVTQLRQRWAAGKAGPARHIMEFGRKATRNFGGKVKPDKGGR